MSKMDGLCYSARSYIHEMLDLVPFQGMYTKVIPRR